MIKRIYDWIVLALLLALPVACCAESFLNPTTSLAAQTANNTSASNSFVTQTNGNIGPGNISKVDIHTLLYPGATTKVYAHLLLWFGQANHMNVGYSSTDPTQIKRQIDDMISRGIDGVIVDWYGPNNSIDQATRLVMAEAENHPGFTFAIMVDQGAIKWNSCPGCSPQEALIEQLQYVETTYATSPAYMRIQDSPVITNFNIDLAYTIDWNAVNASLDSRPAYLFQNNQGFSHPLSSGSFSWVMPTTNDYGMGYLSSFYNTGASFPAEQTVGASYKGFNDTLASWGTNRVMAQQCGQTWLQTFSAINGMYNSDKQLSDLQLVTWNDYEEGTEIETGIDNCQSISSSVSGNSLKWSITGDESKIDHYTAYISSDGELLMKLADFPPGVSSLNLCSFSIPSAPYYLFVQGVGKPGLINQISAATKYSPSCGVEPNLSVTASPSAIVFAADESVSLTVTVTPRSGPFNQSIALSCVGLPKGLNCSFSPTSLIPGAKPVSSTLIITGNQLDARVQPDDRTKALPKHGIPISLGWLFSSGVAGLVLTSKRHKSWRRRMSLGLLLGVGMISVSCGGRNVTTQRGGDPVVVPGLYPLTITGTAGNDRFSTIVNVTIR